MFCIPGFCWDGKKGGMVKGCETKSKEQKSIISNQLSSSQWVVNGLKARLSLVRGSLPGKGDHKN